LASLPILEFDLKTARVHAETLAALPKEVAIGAHDLLIGATVGFAKSIWNEKSRLRKSGLRKINLERKPSQNKFRVTETLE
jgi:predicted nucleic acid-binding protein